MTAEVTRFQLKYVSKNVILMQLVDILMYEIEYYITYNLFHPNPELDDQGEIQLRGA